MLLDIRGGARCDGRRLGVAFTLGEAGTFGVVGTLIEAGGATTDAMGPVITSTPGTLAISTSD